MNAYTLAKETYASHGVDTEEVIKRLAVTPISLHCWQGNDVGGFENAGTDLAGSGIARHRKLPRQRPDERRVAPGSREGPVAHSRLPPP